jgi:hypothetical protein
MGVNDGWPSDYQNKAWNIAHRFIREHYGNIPNAGTPEQCGEYWLVPIEVHYPRIRPLETDMLKRVSFINLGAIGIMKVNLSTGEVFESPSRDDLSKEIELRMRSHDDIPHIQVRTPFSDDQVKSINAFQESDKWHPFTCGKCGAILKASKHGIDCYECGKWFQPWCHSFMADWSWREL